VYAAVRRVLRCAPSRMTTGWAVWLSKSSVSPRARGSRRAVLPRLLLMTLTPTFGGSLQIAPGSARLLAALPVAVVQCRLASSGNSVRPAACRRRASRTAPDRVDLSGRAHHIGPGQIKQRRP
jgi:hypothetical protein